MEARFKKASDVVATLFGRPPGGEETAVLEVPEPVLPKDWPEKLRFRKRPKPYSRSIAWTPVDSDVRAPQDPPYELFVAQSVLREVRQHLITARTGEPFGFLLGQVVYCPWRETPYIAIDSVRRETQDLPPADEMDRFRHAWIAAARDARHRRGEVIGWYHRHGVLGLRLSEWDLRLQEEFFPEPWHCALIIAASRRGIIGGFVQRSGRARLFRKGLAPFRELVDLDAKLVNGLKPSCVDWQNYRAGESVSVIRANWPGSASSMTAWEGERHGPEATLPTAGGPGDAPRERQPSGKTRRGKLGGRSWRTGTPAAPTPAPADGDAGPVKKEEFEEVVRSADDAVVFESEEQIGEPDARQVPKKTSKRTPRPGKPGKPREAGGEDREFLETVWGPPPFDSEDEEPEATEDETQAPSTGEAPRDAERRRSRFELVPTFEPEPLESDEPKSLEWLLSLVGDALGRTAGTGERTERDEAVSEAGEAASEAGEAVSEAGEAASEAGEAGSEADEAASEAGEAQDAEAAAEEAQSTTGVSDDAAGLEEAGALPAGSAVEPSREPVASDAGARRAGQGRRPGGRAFVVPSSDPDADTEAPIPVVVFEEDREGWRPTELQKRIAAGFAIILGGWLAYQSLFSPSAPEPPPTNAAPPPSGLQAAAPPPPEFVDLADAYLTRLQTYRERLVDFRLERVDCAGLADDFGGVLAAHASLAEFVAGRPGLADRFETLTGEFIATRQRFDATGCEPPPDRPEPDTGTGGPGAQADGSGGS